MPRDLDIYKPVLKRMSADHRITVWHLALILAIIQLGSGEDINAPIFISRKRLIELSHIGSIVTYHKCIKELCAFRIIEYFPSYHPGIRTKVFFVLS